MRTDLPPGAYYCSTRSPPARSYSPGPVKLMGTRAIGLALLVGVFFSTTSAAATQAATIPGTVINVVDGDTVDVQFADGGTERIRLIGIDTPEVVDPHEPVQCFGREASARAHDLLDGRAVLVELDPTQGERDRYGRLLAYLWLSDGRN